MKIKDRISLETTKVGIYKHIRNVQYFMNVCIGELMGKAIYHDWTKLSAAELPLFASVEGELKGLTYGSDEYKEKLKDLGPALRHHYANNSHHPECFGKDGIEGMDLMDLMEMVCDWFAATKRHDDGDIMKSLEHNIQRFNLSPQLVSILMNTIKVLQENDDWEEAFEKVEEEIL